MGYAETVAEGTIPDDLLKISEAAELVGVHPNTIRRWVRAGVLPRWNLGPTSVRVRTSDLRNLVTVQEEQ